MTRLLRGESLECRRVLASAAPADPSSTALGDAFISLAEDTAGIRVTVPLGGTGHGSGDIVSIYLNGNASPGTGILLAQSAALTGKESSVSLAIPSGSISTAGNEAKINKLYAEIIDLTGNNATGMSFRSSPGAAFTLDTVPPAITAFTQAGGSLLNKAGSVISLEATVSEPVTGSVAVTLDTGAVVTLSAGGGPSTKLTGAYTVAAKQNSNDLSVLSYTVGSLKDAAGNPLSGTAAATGSIGGAAPIVVDTIAPAIKSIALPPAATYYVTTTPQLLTLTIDFSEPVTLPATAFVRGFIGPNGNANAFATPADFVFSQALNNGSSYQFVYALSTPAAPAPALPPDIDGITFDTTIWDLATPGIGAVIADASGNVLSPTTNALAAALTPNPTAINIGPSTTVAKVVFDAITPTPRVDPVQVVTVTFMDKFNAGSAVPFGPGLGSLSLTEDFQLRRNGVLVDLTTPDSNGKVPQFTYVTNPADPYYASRFQIRNLAHLSALPGAYRLTFSDIGIGPSAELAWTVTYATPGELTATVEAQPVPVAGSSFVRTTPVDSIKVVFTTTGAGGATAPVVVKNVDTAVSGSAIKQFLLYKDEALVPLPATARVTGSGSTYYLTGLASVTQDTGSYDLVVVPDEVTNSLGAPVQILTLSGTPMIAATGTSWQYVNTTIASAMIDSPTGGTGIVRQHDAIDLKVSFTSPVVVDPSLPVPSIDVYLSTYGNGSATATYLSGSGTKDLTFRYMVQSGDVSPSGIAFASSIALNGGSILDIAGKQPLLSFKQPSAAGIVVDTVAPQATGFVLPTGIVYSPSAHLLLGVVFDEAMQVTGSPQLAFTFGGQSRSATFDRVDASTVYFRYDLLPTDAGSSVITARSVALNGGRMADLAGNPAILSGLVSATTNLPVDTQAPPVTNVTSSTANGSYRAGDTITIVVTFGEAVTVAGGTPTLRLNAGGSAIASWTGAGSGTNSLTFDYVVEPGDATTRLDYADASALALGGATIRDAAGNNAILTLPAVGGAGSIGSVKKIVIDSVAPTIMIVASPTTLTGIQKSVVTFTVSDDTAAAVLHGKSLPADAIQGGTLSPLRVTAALGGREYTATFTPTLNAVGPGSITVPAGWFSDKAGNGNDLTVMSGSIVHVPTVQSFTTATAAGRYTVGSAPMFFVVAFDEAVTINGVPPRLALNVGANRFATYEMGNGTSSLTFKYVVQPGDSTAALDGASTAALVGDLRNAAGTAAVTTLPVPGSFGSLSQQATIIVDTVAPLVTAIRPRNTPNGSYSVGTKVRLQVEFSEPVVVAAGVPLLKLNASGSAVATWNGVGSGTNTLVFVYTVKPGDNIGVLDASGAASLSGVIRDLTGNAATLAAPVGSQAGSLASTGAIGIDTLAPAVAGVSTTASAGSYRAGTGIWIQARFTETVVVTGSPQLLLNAASNRVATYHSGSGTNTLLFLYVVQPGDSAATLDYESQAALVTNGGAIRDVAGNAAALVLAPPGGPGSIAAATAVRIDTAAPTVSAVRAISTNGTYGLGQSVRISVTMSEPVRVTGAAPVLMLNTKPIRQAAFEGPFDALATTLTFLYTIQPGDVVSRLDAVTFATPGSTIVDQAGNLATTSLPATGAPESLAGSSAIAIDAIIRASAGGLSTAQETAPTYNVALTRLTLTFNAPVSGLTVAALRLFYEGRSVSLTGATLAGSGLTYTLTLPQAITSLKGLYRLRIGGNQAGVTAAGGVPMEPATNLYWRRS